MTERDKDNGGVRGFIRQGLPDELVVADTFEGLRENLVLYAKMREESEPKGRTHYRTLVSFERQLPSATAAEMVQEWLAATFPNARCIGFVHTNTAHPHVHVWIDARKVDGKKLDLSPGEYRGLDVAWNRIYAREMQRDEREHLEKKSYEYQQRKAPPQRCRHPTEDGKERTSSRSQRDLSTEVEGGASAAQHRESAASPRERTVAKVIAVYEQAIRIAQELLRVVENMGGRSIFWRTPNEPERER